MNVVAACVVLYNICELQGDTCDPDWIQESHSAIVDTTTTTNNSNAKLIRDALKIHLYANQ